MPVSERGGSITSSSGANESINRPRPALEVATRGRVEESGSDEGETIRSSFDGAIAEIQAEVSLAVEAHETKLVLMKAEIEGLEALRAESKKKSG